MTLVTEMLLSQPAKISATNWVHRSVQLGLSCVLGLGVWASGAIAQETLDPVPNRPDAETPAAIAQSEAERLMREADRALDAQNYDLAIELLTDAFNTFNTRSNYYQQLSSVFAGVDNAIADEHRVAARDAAEERDRASYDLAIVYRAADRPEEAIGPLVQVIASQGPTRDLGQKAYQQLKEIGFVTTAYPR